MAHTLPTLLASIRSQRLSLAKYNRDPKDLYLGYNEYDILRMYGKVNCVYNSLFSLDTLRFDGLTVHRVNEPNHVKVTD